MATNASSASSHVLDDLLTSVNDCFKTHRYFKHDSVLDLLNTTSQEYNLLKGAGEVTIELPRPPHRQNYEVWDFLIIHHSGPERRYVLESKYLSLTIASGEVHFKVEAQAISSSVFSQHLEAIVNHLLNDLMQWSNVGKLAGGAQCNNSFLQRTRTRFPAPSPALLARVSGLARDCLVLPTGIVAVDKAIKSLAVSHRKDTKSFDVLADALSTVFGGQKTGSPSTDLRYELMLAYYHHFMAELLNYEITAVSIFSE
jgi:hypothetical protein